MIHKKHEYVESRSGLHKRANDVVISPNAEIHLLNLRLFRTRLDAA